REVARALDRMAGEAAVDPADREAVVEARSAVDALQRRAVAGRRRVGRLEVGPFGLAVAPGREAGESERHGTALLLQPEGERGGRAPDPLGGRDHVQRPGL